MKPPPPPDRAMDSWFYPAMPRSRNTGEEAMRTTNDTRGSLLGRVTRAQPDDDRTRLNMRHLLESSGVPFRSAEYARRSAIFRQGDPSDNVFHIESGAVLLAVSAHSGQEAICGVLGSGAFLGEEALRYLR